MRAGRTEEASAIASRIGGIIVKQNTIQMKKLDMQNGAKEIWSQYNKLTKGKSSYVKAPAGVTAAALNNHYAAVSSDKSYRPTHPKLTCTTEINSFVTERDVFNLMDKLRPTATGLDLIPAWFLRLVAPVFAAPISQCLTNQSVKQLFLFNGKRRSYAQYRRLHIRNLQLISDPYP